MTKSWKRDDLPEAGSFSSSSARSVSLASGTRDAPFTAAAVTPGSPLPESRMFHRTATVRCCCPLLSLFACSRVGESETMNDGSPPVMETDAVLPSSVVIMGVPSETGVLLPLSVRVSRISKRTCARAAEAEDAGGASFACGAPAAAECKKKEAGSSKAAATVNAETSRVSMSKGDFPTGLVCLLFYPGYPLSVRFVKRLEGGAGRLL